MKQAYTPMTKEDLLAIKKGDVIERMLGFSIPVYLIVQNVTDDIIDAGWLFDRETGFEIDEDLQDMSLPIQQRMQISYIRRVLNDDQKKILDDGAKEVPFEERK